MLIPNCVCMYREVPRSSPPHASILDGHGTFWIQFLNLTGDTTYYIVSTTTGSLTTELRGSFNTCNTQDLMAPNTVVQPQSSCSEASGNIRLACYSEVTPGSTVTYHYPPGSSVSQSTIRCQSDGTWSGTTPNNGELSHSVIGYMLHWYSGHSSPFNCFIEAFISFGVKWICKASFWRSPAELLVQKWP